jgi:hypothetical protein
MFIESPHSGVPKYFLSKPKDWGLRVPDDVKKCTGFVGLRAGFDPVFGGTCFFVGMRSSLPNRFFYYICTAKHVAVELEHGDWVIRVNNKLGKAILVEGTGSKWWYHPTDPAIDVGVLPFTPNVKELDILAWPVHGFATTDRCSQAEYRCRRRNIYRRTVYGGSGHREKFADYPDGKHSHGSGRENTLRYWVD